ncbi:MAG TPA: ABC transporter substrate-binding protein [Bryobacteraceae bacterium]|nr:ABC transporter substrate-binding protein [Bryobacteraceae bacterium]
MRACRCIIAAVLLTGCGNEPPVLTVAINAGVEGDALKAAAAEWGARNRMRVDIVELPYANLFEKELLDLTSRTGAYDIVMMDDPWFPRMVENGQLTPLEKQPDADFLASCLDVCREPYRMGAFYALPYVGNSQLFFYRKDLFDKYGVATPATWNEVLGAAKKISAAEKIFGYVMRAAPGNAVITDFMPLFWAFGAEIFDSNGHAAVATPEAVECVRFMLELGKYSPPGYTGFNADEVSGHLLQSTAVMSINWPAWIAAMDDPARSKIPGKIAFAQMPSARRKGVAELGSWLLGIPAGSKNKRRAAEFLFWVTAPEQMKQAALRGNPPTRRSVFLDPELRARFRAFPAQLASLESARPRPRTPLWNEIENAFGIRISQANSGSATPEEALQRANQEIEAIVQRGK